MPTPDTELLARSEQLTDIIRAEISHQGAINFAEYMQLALYYPQLGYYSGNKNKLGQAGDFVTAPELSPLFSATLAHYIAEQGCLSNHLLEFGAGSGKMAADILLRLEALDALPEAYYILDVSPDLQQRQKETFTHLCPHLLDKVCWLTQLPKDFKGIILANEVLDAMPVHCFKWEQNTLYERHVAWSEGKLIWQDKVAENPALIAYLQPYLATLPQPYFSEVNLAALAWINELGKCLIEGEILLLDYGFHDPAFYHPQRDKGTLRCYYQHHAHDDPLLWPGLQDITAHVHFEKILQTAEAAGFILKYYDNQANFLIHYGILTLAQVDNIITQYETAQPLKRLLLPTEMGESVKVLRLAKEK